MRKYTRHGASPLTQGFSTSTWLASTASRAACADAAPGSAESGALLCLVHVSTACRHNDHATQLGVKRRTALTGDSGDPEAGTVQLTTTTDDSEAWPENSGDASKPGVASGPGVGHEVDFKKVPVDEALSILKVSSSHGA